MSSPMPPETDTEAESLADRLRPKLTLIGMFDAGLFALLFGLYFTGTVSLLVFAPLLLVFQVLQTTALLVLISKTRKQMEAEWQNHSSFQDES